MSNVQIIILSFFTPLTVLCTAWLAYIRGQNATEVLPTEGRLAGNLRFNPLYPAVDTTLNTIDKSLWVLVGDVSSFRQLLFREGLLIPDDRVLRHLVILVN